MFVSEGVLARGVEDDQRAVGDDGSELFVVDGIDAVATPADADAAEVARRVRLDDAVDVLSLLRFGLRSPCEAGR